MDAGNDRDKNVNNRTFRYFSKVAGSKFIMPDGKELFFMHGFHDLKEADYRGQKFQGNTMQGHEPDRRNGTSTFEVYKQELDALIKAGNPLLYIQGSQPEPLPSVGADANAHTEGDVAKAESLLKNVTHREMGEVNRGPNQTDVNTSTVDPNLQRQLLAESPAVAAARAAAATRNGAASGTSAK